MAIETKNPKKSSIVYPVVKVRDVALSYWAAVKHFKPTLAVTILGIAVASILEVAIPLQYKRFFDLLSSTDSPALAAPALVSIIVTVLTLNILAWISWRLATVANNYFQPGVMARLKEGAFEYLMGHSYSFFANSFTGGLVQRVNRYAHAFERLADRIYWSVLPLVIRIVGAFVVVSLINAYIGYILLGWVLVFLGCNYLFARWKLKYSVRRAEADSHTTAVLSDAITNQSTVQLFTMFKPESERFRKATRDQASITTFTWNLDTIVEGIQAALFIAIEFALFYYAIQYWEVGLITVGTFILVQTYLLGLVSRLWDFSRIVRDFYEGFANAKEMVEILGLSHEVSDKKGARHLAIERGEVWFDDVSFKFSDGVAVLHQFNLRVVGGERVALVGPSGAGKSTVTKLLLRLYDVQGGAINIDNQNIANVTQDSLREQIAFVPQEPILFHRTLMENIRYGKREATDEEVIEAAKQAHCHEFISKLPLGYDTFVGERGIKLSGGERQRVAIARAILKNAPILILDEATSSLDSESESYIQEALEVLMQGKTVIVIAHRLSTIMKMDRIVVMEEGQIVAQGTHLQLIRERGLYQKLWNIQAGGFIGLTNEANTKRIGVGASDSAPEEIPVPVVAEVTVKKRQARVYKKRTKLADRQKEE